MVVYLNLQLLNWRGVNTMSENYEPIRIVLTKEQANRLAKHLDNYIFDGMADICESINYQIDHHEFNMLIKDDKDYVPSFFNPLAD